MAAAAKGALIVALLACVQITESQHLHGTSTKAHPGMRSDMRTSARARSTNLPGLHMRAANGSVDSRTAESTKASKRARPIRRLQAATTCAAGTTAVYGDENLAFRFRPENITTAADGSVRWPAIEPPGLAFTMTRYEEPPEHYDPSEAATYYSAGNASEPTRVLPASDVIPGLLWDHGEGADGVDVAYDQVMYSNLKLAYGVKSTMFIVVTPTRIPPLWASLVLFRPGSNIPGNMLYGWATGEGDPEGVVFQSDWAGGFSGPSMTPNQPHIIIARSHYGHNSLGNAGPISDFAVVNLASSILPDELQWSSRLNRDGIKNYNLPLHATDEFEFDFRDHEVDGQHALAAGYMMLGHASIPYGHYVCFSGVIHAFELHSETLGDADVLDVVNNMAKDISPNHAAQARVRCRACKPGTQDKDLEADTECVPCEVGRYSEHSGATSCQGSCPAGSTVVEAGAASAANCSQCGAGKYGPVEAEGDTLQCASCEAGRRASEPGSDSESDCIQCGHGLFSSSGSSVCEPSGCTDTAASNYNASAIVDEGNCRYLCAELRMGAGIVNPSGGCIIDGFESGWQRFDANGVETGEQGEAAKIDEVLLDESWLIQGRPLPGASLRQPLCSDYSQRIDVHGNLTARYITIQDLGAVRTDSLGGALRLWDGAMLVLEHSNLLNNDNAEYGGGTQAGPQSYAKHSYVVVADSLADARGGAGEFYGNKMEYNYCSILRNSCSLRPGGAFYGYMNAVLQLSHTEVIANSGPSGGAIHLESGCLAKLDTVLFEANVAAIRGGGVSVIMAAVDMVDCTFVDNQAATLGTQVYLDQPTSVKILHTEFDPFIDGGQTVFFGGRLAGCPEHPCDPGFSCSYSRYSLHCTACPELQMSTDGLKCSRCGAGEEPMLNQSGCVPCSGTNQFSTSGVCQQCDGMAVKDERGLFTVCMECPAYMSADPERGCVCEPGTYNASNGFITCHHQDYDGVAFDESSLYEVARLHFSSGEDINHVCLSCPYCVDCDHSNDPPRIRAGYSISEASKDSGVWSANAASVNKTVVQCRSELSRLTLQLTDELVKEAMGRDTDFAVYSDEKAQCLGTLNGTEPMCSNGHYGSLCGSCVEDYGRKDSNRCVKCDDALKPESIVTTVAFIIGLFAILGMLMIGLAFYVDDVYAEALGESKGRLNAKSGVKQLHEILSSSNPDNVQVFANPVQESSEPTMLADTKRTASEDLTDPTFETSMSQLRQLFNDLDDTKSGFIDREDVAKLARAMGVTLSKHELDDTMKSIDTQDTMSDDFDGHVTFEEFEKWWHHRESGGKGLFPTLKLSGLVVFSSAARMLKAAVTNCFQPVKIFISYWQIAGNMGVVLHFQFPPYLGNIIAVFKPLVAAVHGVVALECAGLTGGFYVAWMFEVLVVPCILWGCVLLYFFSRVATVGRAEAAAKAYNEAFFVLFLTYPVICNKLFKMLDCRHLSEDEHVLASDYAIDCSTEKHQSYQFVAGIMVVVFALGVPLGMLLVLARSRRKEAEVFTKSPQWQYITRRAATQLAHDDLREVQQVIIDISLGSRYGTLVNAFKPGMFWWECVDMLRKLLLVGMLTLVQQGTSLQVFAGVVISFGFFAAHTRTMPYRHVEDNILKATTEVHLFLIMNLVLLQKTDLSSERYGMAMYDVIATVLFVIFVPICAISCLVSKWWSVGQHEKQAKAFTTRTQYLQAAFQRHRLGRDKEADRELLGDWIGKMEDEVNSHYHVFISYRVQTEKKLAKALFDKLSGMTLVESGQKLRVYLDSERLEDGERWDSGFMNGLSASWIVVPILSSGSLGPMADLAGSESCDNCLLEWIAALELFGRRGVKAVMPIIACDEDGNEFKWHLPKSLSNDEHEPTINAAKKHLRKHETSDGVDVLAGAREIIRDVSTSDDGSTDADGDRPKNLQVSTKGVADALMRFQGIILTDRTDIADPVDRIFDKVSTLLSRGATRDEMTL